jgi:hypothetical protein
MPLLPIQSCTSALQSQLVRGVLELWLFSVDTIPAVCARRAVHRTDVSDCRVRGRLHACITRSKENSKVELLGLLPEQYLKELVWDMLRWLPLFQCTRRRALSASCAHLEAFAVVYIVIAGASSGIELLSTS